MFTQKLLVVVQSPTTKTSLMGEGSAYENRVNFTPTWGIFTHISRVHSLFVTEFRILEQIY
jgi:hypothetical protein